MIPINFNQFLLELENVLKSPRPWMHARYGDGEGIVMGYPEFTGETRCRQRWNKWLGTNNIDMKKFAVEIRNSINNCDIVGTPCLRHQKVNSDWRNVKHFMHKYDLLQDRTKTCCMDCTVELQTKGHYKRLLSNRDSIYYISCRDMYFIFTKRLNIKNVFGFILPPQHRPCKGKVYTNKKHYPDLFNEIKFWLDRKTIKNNLFLVGAGGLGKIYCSWIKERGGIALDIGSIFDGWDGLVTRSYLKNIGKFEL